MNNDLFINPSMEDRPPVRPAKGLALASFLCGLGSLVCCTPAAGVVGIILSHIAKKKGNTSGMRKAGLVCSICGIVLSVLISALMLVVSPAILEELDYGLFGDMTYEEATVPPVRVTEEETTRELTLAEMFVYSRNGNNTYSLSIVEGAVLPAEVTIPSRYRNGTVTEIEIGAFSGQHRLETVFIPDTVTVIRPGAFAECTKLTEVRFSDNLEAIYDQAFYGCTALKQVTLPEGVTTIGYECFASCTNLNEVKLPDSLYALGMAAFRNCENLAPTVPLPASLTAIPECAYQDCRFPTFVLTEGITYIGAFAFNGDYLNSIVYPGTMEEWETRVTKEEYWYVQTSPQPMMIICEDGTVTLPNE